MLEQTPKQGEYKTLEHDVGCAVRWRVLLAVLFVGEWSAMLVWREWYPWIQYRADNGNRMFMVMLIGNGFCL